jgi:hypothetical protein
MRMNGDRSPARAHTSPSASRRIWRRCRWIAAAAALPLALWACTGHPLEQPKPAPEQQTDLRYEVNPVRKLDLIFMIDNSSSMKDKQDNLRKNFPSFMNKLLSIEGGAPDMHIAVISSNVGAGQTAPDRACNVGGDRGRFQVRPECGIDTTKTGYFLTVDAAGKTNFEDKGGLPKLPELFQCMAFLGDNGCGYEHSLLSLYFALDGKTNPENAGFLRDDAYLGVVMLSDEDDCSGEPTADFFADPPVKGVSGSVRCSFKGHTCNGQAVPQMPGFSAPLSACMPYVRDDAAEKNSRLINVQFFVDFLKGLKKGRADKILVSEVIGWSDAADATYRIVNNAKTGDVDTGLICSDSGPAGGAAPGLRLHAFAKAFQNNTIFPICQTDLSPAMTDIADALIRLIENTCIQDPLFDIDGDKTNGVQPDCQVDDLVPLDNGSGLYRAQSLPACSLGKGMPCWDLDPDLKCGGGYRTKVSRTTPAAPGTVQSIKCLTCPVGHTENCTR